MEIRKATAEDIPGIVKVLKASLGEDQLELSEKVWNYKHIENPFGKSLVLLATEDQKIIGVRAFMCWEWQCGQNIYKALRAVDTATHPDHQGKGIFKKLTLKAVNDAVSMNYHFIFNTPNEQSRPGYIKMGWREVGKVNVGLKPSISFIRLVSKPVIYEVNKLIPDTQLKDLCDQWNKKLITEKNLFTPKNPERLKWRYEENPLQSYEILVDRGIYLAAYIKKRGRFSEFRIAECIYNDDIISTKELRKIIGKMVRKFSCHIVSYSPNLMKLKSKNGHFGPILTFNSLNLDEEKKSSFLNINKWDNSLGDLELF